MKTQFEILIHKIRILDVGKKIQFQIDLPADAKRIVGIEHSAMKLSGTTTGLFLEPTYPWEFSADKLIGRLSLQVPGKEGIFYQSEIKEHRNLSYGEEVASKIWVPKPWVYSTRRDPIEINIDDNISFIEGFFEDYWAALEFSALDYILNLYFWIELKENDN